MNRKLNFLRTHIWESLLSRSLSLSVDEPLPKLCSAPTKRTKVNVPILTFLNTSLSFKIIDDRFLFIGLRKEKK